MMKFSITVIALILSSNSFACSCSSFQSLDSSFTQANVVILAALENTGEKEEGCPWQIYRWRVQETLKGEAPKNLHEVTQRLTSCDPQLEEGQKWLIFLKESEEIILGWCNPHKNIKYLEKDWRSKVGENH